MKGQSSSRDEFPFPLTDGPNESRQLTWLRNHSNFMLVHGGRDYLRAVGVLIRGMLINTLIFLPYLLLFSMLVSASILYETLTAFAISKHLMVLFVAWIVLFSIGTPLLRIVRYQRTRALGSDSSVKQRDWYERSFGAFLIAILGAVVIESMPYLLQFYRTELGAPSLATIAVGTTTVLAAYPSLLPFFKVGLIRKFAFLAVGCLGLLVPLTFVLYTIDFLLYSPPTDLTIINRLASLPFPLLILIAIALGYWQRAFTRRDLKGILAMIAASFAVLVMGFWSDNYAFDRVKMVSKLSAPVLKKLSDNEAIKAEIVKEFAESPEIELTLLYETLRQDRGTRPEMDRFSDDRLNELAKLGWQAGRNPEFLHVLSAVAAHPDCLETPGEKEICEALWQEIQHFKPRLETLASLFNAASDEQKGLTQLATKVIELSEVQLANLMESSDRYPLLTRLEGICPDGPLGGPSVEPFSTLPARQAGTCFEQIADSEGIASFHHLVSKVRGKAAVKAVIERFDQWTPDEVVEPLKLFRQNAFFPKALFVFLLAVQLLWFCWLTVDVNLTSIHGLYRDRLATAFLSAEHDVGVDVTDDVDLMGLSNHQANSVAPYHLINVALNLQSSRLMNVRDRRSDFFIFSKRFVGGKLTGYCRSETMERVFPQMDLGTAMAISGAAAAPNMGRATNPMLVGVMTMLNVRTGFWLPNPGLLEDWVSGRKGRSPESMIRRGLSFENVFTDELVEVNERWRQQHSSRTIVDAIADQPSTDHRLAGLAFSGGGIRSATLNLGLVQALQASGAFDHFDYLSTVSGGGYLGASISAAMRGKVEQPTQQATTAAPRVAIQSVSATDGSIGEIYRWRVPPTALIKEILGRLDERSRWVNVSDGGHIENLGAIELIRRRCRYVLIGDAEADPKYQFNGLATLVRTARIDLGVEIDIKVDLIRPGETGLSQSYWAIGQIHYPPGDGDLEGSIGYMLYVKSAITGHEDVLIQQYRDANPSFPHESTADQMFNEGQFEAYRSLGQRIGEQILAASPWADARSQTAESESQSLMTFDQFEYWFAALKQA